MYLKRFSTAIAGFLFFTFFTTATDSNLFAGPQGNSTRKIRVQPNEVTQRIGTAVNWAANFEDAAQRSRESGKPIFWYVPTIPGTFMDRKTEIDRYMLAGPFSWPPVVKILNQHFVPLRATPSRQLQKKYELSRYKFIEPGFLVLKNGSPIGKIDQLTTLHYQWWATNLSRFCSDDLAKQSTIDVIRKRYLNQTESFEIDQNAASELMPYEMYYAALAKFRKGKQADADAVWGKLIQSFPNHPLAWKASAELQRIGPFCRGFEVHNDIPTRGHIAGQARGTRAPVGLYTIPELWQRSTHFLLGMQNESGAFLDSDYDFGGTDSLPNVHVAVTSLAGMALIEAHGRNPDLKPSIQNAVDRCFKFVSNEKNLNRVDRDEILWADAYRLRFLCRYAKFTRKDVQVEITAATKALENLQSKRGSWYHEYANSFVTATALTALKEAKNSGATLDENKINKGVGALVADRFPNGAFPYSTGRRGAADPAKAIAGAAGRMPLCEVALAKWGRSNQTALRHAIETSFKHQDNLDIALKYDNHTSTHGYGGFFFWYDMRARCEAILSVTDADRQEKYLKQQLAIISKLPEIDGCFVDSHELGRSYGTAMALICLANIESILSQ